MPNPKTNSKSLATEYSIIITQYMTSDIHLTGTTHCRKGCFLHNSTPNGRKVGTQNMTAKGTWITTDNVLVHIQTRNTTDDTLVHIQTLRYISLNNLVVKVVYVPLPLLHRLKQKTWVLCRGAQLQRY